jgi:hypothetical protein
MHIEFTLHLWEIVLASALILPPAFVYYIKMSQTYKEFGLPAKLLLCWPLPFVGLVDVVFNIFFGTLWYLSIPLRYGITFSQQTCYWYSQTTGWRLNAATDVKRQLDKIDATHIHKLAR